MSYDAEIAVAVAMIQARGTKLAYTKTARGTVGMGTDMPASSTPTTKTVDAVVLPARRDPNLTNEQNVLVQKNSRRLIIAGSTWGFDTDPAPEDTVVAEGTTWNVSGSTRVAPDGDQAKPIIFKVTVAR